MSDATAKKVYVWALSARFLSLGKPYAGRIVLTILVCLLASGAKAAQSFILKPLIDNARKIADEDKDKKNADGDNAREKSPDSAAAKEMQPKPSTWMEQFRKPMTWDTTFIAVFALTTALIMCVFGWLK